MNDKQCSVCGWETETDRTDYRFAVLELAVGEVLEDMKNFTMPGSAVADWIERLEQALQGGETDEGV